MKAHHGGDAQVADGMVFPRYGGQSLANIPATICAALGVPMDTLMPRLDASVLPPHLLQGVRAVCLLVVDGLGASQLQAAIRAGGAPNLADPPGHRPGGGDWSVSTLTSVFPSSTMPALATLNTGLPPAAHGLLGWTVYLDEFGEAAELARWGPADRPGSYLDQSLGGHDPQAFFPVETLHQRLGRHGVRSVAICPVAHRGSGLSDMILRGAELPGYYATSSILPTVDRVLTERSPGERVYVYGYWPTLDTVSHHHGPLGVEHAAELTALDFALGQWLRAHERRGDVLLLLTADHGHVPTDWGRAVHLDAEPDLLDDLEGPPTGERRLAYLRARPGRAAAGRAYCAERLSEVVELLDSTEALEQGFFGPGPISAAARRRAGDLILLARDDRQLVCARDGHEPEALLGNHGALDPCEMLVPLVALRL